MRSAQLLPRPIASLVGELLGGSLADLVYRLSALGLLLYPVGSWAIRPLTLLLAVGCMLSPRILRSPWTWLLLFTLTGWRVFDDWPLADNHAYLLSYWCLTLFLAAALDERRALLALNGRWLIFLTFCFASLWKGVLSPDYLDGTFFRITFVTDNRFTDAMLLFGGFDEEGYFRLRDALQPMPEGMIPADRPVPVEPARFSLLVTFATWGTLALEVAIAIGFLVPTGSWLGRVRHGLLLLFCTTVYALAPVASFGWLLLTLGLAQTRAEERTVRPMYLIGLALLVLYDHIPWAGLLLDLR